MAPQSFAALYVIPNAIIPYAYETIPILGIPNGFKSRFRFKDDWVSEQFKISYESYIKKPIYIVLRNFNTGCLIPLRSGIVEDINRIGSIYFISYRLGPLAEFDSNPPTRENQIISFNERFFEYHREQLAKVPGQHMKPLVFGSNFSYALSNVNSSTSDYYEQDLERFENIISSIKSFDIFVGVQFLKIVDLKELKNEKPARVTDYNYLLHEDAEYHLRLYQTTPTPLPERMKEPNDITISSDSKYIDILQGKKRAVGKYDVLSYVFRTTFNSASARTFIEVHHKTKHEDEQFIEPSFSIPIKITYTTNRSLLNILYLVSFVGVYFYPQILKFITIIPAGLIKDLAVVGFTVAIMDLKKNLTDLLKRS